MTPRQDSGYAIKVPGHESNRLGSWLSTPRDVARIFRGCYVQKLSRFGLDDASPRGAASRLKGLMIESSELIDRVRAYQPAADADLLKRAYDFSEKAHTGQKRKSGDPYFIHPASVAGIITELRLDTASVCAGLLHDVVEDTLATTKDIEREFGGEIASLVDGVTKLGKINFTSK